MVDINCLVVADDVLAKMVCAVDMAATTMVLTGFEVVLWTSDVVATTVLTGAKVVIWTSDIVATTVLTGSEVVFWS